MQTSRKFRIEQTGLEGAFFIERSEFRDERGTFCELWRDKDYHAAGIHLPFVQDNCSRSVRGALRGLHAQRAPHEQGKLITVLAGSIFDVIVDLRPESRTFGRAAAFELDDARRQLWIPPGFAHGFQAVSDQATVHYKCTAYHSSDHEITVLWCDPELGIDWPIANPLLSAKDSNARTLREVISRF